MQATGGSSSTFDAFDRMRTAGAAARAMLIAAAADKWDVAAASLKTENGTVFSGCNVENVAYPEGTCAEAGAIAAMCAAGEREIAEVYVIAGSPKPVTPCGGCRQRILEFADENTRIIYVNDGEFENVGISDILPASFRL